MKLLSILPLLLVAGSARAAEIPVAACPADEPRTIAILVRHADRDGELLNDKGWDRARALRDLVLDELGEVHAVIHTTYERTKQTLEPILQYASMGDRKVEQHEFDPHDYAAAAVRIRAAHRSAKGRTVVVYSGHSDTVRPILEQFRPDQVEAKALQWFPCEGDICHSDYDNLWTVTLCGKARPEIRKTNFGAPTPAQ